MLGMDWQRPRKTPTPPARADPTHSGGTAPLTHVSHASFTKVHAQDMPMLSSSSLAMAKA